MSDQQSISHPEVADSNAWRKARLDLLKEEKAHTKAMDRLNAKRRRLPMVGPLPAYEFEGPEGRNSLLDLFQDKRQLIVYHFMFAPDWEEGCIGCTGFVNALGDLSMLGERDTRLVLVSRAPLEKLEAWRDKHGWDLPWYSSGGSTFNDDFQATGDEEHTLEYNYRTPESAEDAFLGERHGMSIFFRLDDDAFHTYSCYARGTECLTDSYSLLDLTPYGRQEDFEDSPEGWPQKPTYG